MTTAFTRPGLAALERIAATLSDDVWVVAPETRPERPVAFAVAERSAAPARDRRASASRCAARRATASSWRCAGCSDGKPDLVLSGVNSGSNVADDVTYSGTIAGAIEGTLLGVPSIALSQAYTYDDGERVVPWETAEAHAPAIIRKLIAFGFPPRRPLQSQLPQPRAGRGRRASIVTAQGKLDPRPPHRRAPRRRATCRISGWPTAARSRRSRRAATSTRWSAGAISVTPLRLDMTAHDLADPLRHHFAAERDRSAMAEPRRRNDERRIRIADLILRLRRAGVTDQRVVAAIESVPREMFVPAESQARGLCRARAADRLRPDDQRAGDRRHDDRGARHRRARPGARDRHRHRLPDRGARAGSRRRVYTIDRFRTLVEAAESRFRTLRLSNITTIVGDGMKGWPEQAPFDRIIVTAAGEDGAARR